MEDKKEEVKETPKVVETIEVDKAGFETFAKNYKKQEEELKQLRADLDRVAYASDKARLSIYDSKTKKKVIPECKLRTFIRVEGEETNTYIIKGWRTLEDTVLEQTNGVFLVKQDVEVILEDKDGKTTKETMPLRTFGTTFKYIPAKIIAETKDAELDVEIAKVKLEDGREFNLDKTFIN